MILRTFLRAKIHRATITEANPDYHGSIAIDALLLERAGIAPFEQVDVYNLDNGERLTTYAIAGLPGEICLNGAAARKGAPGQRVIIACYAQLSEEALAGFAPSLVFVDQDNALVDSGPAI